LLIFATEGVPARNLLDPDTFVSNAHDPQRWPHLQPVYLRGQDAVNSMLSSTFHTPGLGIILLKEVVLRRHQEQSGGPLQGNMFSSSWAPNAGKPLGRPTANPKALNSRFTKLSADKAWGEVHHPDLGRIAVMIVQFIERMQKLGYSWQ
jgi:hypothetical protein